MLLSEVGLQLASYEERKYERLLYHMETVNTTLPKIQFFGWRICQNALPTGEKLAAKNIGNEVFPLCNQEVETTLYTLKNCPKSKYVLLLSDHERSLVEWHSTSFDRDVVMKAWELATDVVTVNKWSCEPMVTMDKISRRHWQRSSSGCIKINVDGAYLENNGEAAIGVVAHDLLEVTIERFARSIINSLDKRQDDHSAVGLLLKEAHEALARHQNFKDEADCIKHDVLLDAIDQPASEIHLQALFLLLSSLNHYHPRPSSLKSYWMNRAGVGLSDSATKMREAEKVVCVTEASGFIGSWLVNFLLDRGYSVNATIRDPKKTQHLLALVGANERLHLFKAELLDEGSFDSAVEGCIWRFPYNISLIYSFYCEGSAELMRLVIAKICDLNCGCDHIFGWVVVMAIVAADAITVIAGRNDIAVFEYWFCWLAEMVEPAVKGTLNVLRASAKVPSIKRVFITFSLAAVVLTGKPLADDVIVDETWFFDPVLCRKSKQWYMLSKIVAEKAAWEFSNESGIDMVSINPGMVSEPPLQPTVNVSLSPIMKLIGGAENFSYATFRWVDVRDVTDVHIHAFECSSAHGRYLVTGKPMHSSEVLKILRELYPDLNFPESRLKLTPYLEGNKLELHHPGFILLLMWIYLNSLESKKHYLDKRLSLGALILPRQVLPIPQAISQCSYNIRTTPKIKGSIATILISTTPALVITLSRGLITALLKSGYGGHQGSPQQKLFGLNMFDSLISQVPSLVRILCYSVCVIVTSLCIKCFLLDEARIGVDCSAVGVGCAGIGVGLGSATRTGIARLTGDGMGSWSGCCSARVKSSSEKKWGGVSSLLSVVEKDEERRNSSVSPSPSSGTGGTWVASGGTSVGTPWGISGGTCDVDAWNVLSPAVYLRITLGKVDNLVLVFGSNSLKNALSCAFLALTYSNSATNFAPRSKPSCGVSSSKLINSGTFFLVTSVPLGTFMDFLEDEFSNVYLPSVYDQVQEHQYFQEDSGVVKCWHQFSFKKVVPQLHELSSDVHYVVGWVFEVDVELPHYRRCYGFGIASKLLPVVLLYHVHHLRSKWFFFLGWEDKHIFQIYLAFLKDIKACFCFCCLETFETLFWSWGFP
ncbi:hypothetical protein F3Y22_tig00110584pilonHSYRG00571 [Hibiscus syriacus]|uniref:Reverse transcriptase zinc-binding domain-containing protein n=1 Tax=Hibiscus syriacus TaxID=106335 RepID=A0A6A3A4R7_HIBSY|nr:hypothetical protein F3Y22_tig00110584pilonHSYRG00571 [Hibiscus syriacus]